MNETRYFCQVCKRELKGEVQKQFAVPIVNIEPCKHCIRIASEDASVDAHESGWSEGYKEGRKDGRNNVF